MNAPSMGTHAPTSRRAVAPADLRSVAGRFPTGVTVITCRDRAGDIHGMTANSFVSISLDPPTILVSVRPGRMHAMIAETGRFAVNLLAADQEAISHHFSKKTLLDAVPGFDLEDGMPVLRDAIGFMVCDVADSVRVNDHTLFFGAVSACGHAAGEPLVFYGSAYRRLEQDREGGGQGGRHGFRDWLAQALKPG
jgi:flavin reductase (DIM6/NTAB) family NADH-FMN oxidoreductase RutF